ncbi:MAG TPA: hypothetical protein VLW17_12000, partial [Thermoanaerobaculaceae bacterium]|nr:hypothetical protein [Thermoanaerobaculaceae bacterium]
ARWLQRWLVPAIGVLALVGYAAVYRYELNGPPIRSDAVGYYAYLPSYILLRDPWFARIGPLLRRHGYAATDEPPAWTGLQPVAGTGRRLDQYTIGEAVLLLPFFALAHAVACAAGVAPDGFTWPYQFAVSLAGLAYALLGLYLTQRLLARWFSARVVAATLCCLCFGTNLFHYATYDSALSHAFSFCAVTALLAVIPRWYQNPSWRTSASLGAVCAAVALIRPTNAVVFVAVPLFGIAGISDLAARRRWLLEHRSAVAFAAATVLLAFSPQLLIWHGATGSWLVNPHLGQGFELLSPRLFKVLFSVRKGLFFWSPMLVGAVAGLWPMRRLAREWVAPTAATLALGTWVIASWHAWAYGGSFGHRGFVDLYAFFALGLASLFATLRSVRARWTVGAVAAALIALSIFQMVQYWKGIIPFDNTSWELYRRVFLRL